MVLGEGKLLVGTSFILLLLYGLDFVNVHLMTVQMLSFFNISVGLECLDTKK